MQKEIINSTELGVVKVGDQFHTLPEMDEWYRSNHLELKGKARREIGRREGIAEMSARPEGLGSSADPRPLPEAWQVALIEDHPDGTKSYRLRKGDTRKTVTYQNLLKEYINDPAAWIEARMTKTREKLEQQAQRIKQNSPSAQEASAALRAAKALIESDAKLAPSVRDARLAIRPSYGVQVERAAAVVAVEIQSRKLKTDFAAEYKKAKLAGRL